MIASASGRRLILVAAVLPLLASAPLAATTSLAASSSLAATDAGESPADRTQTAATKPVARWDAPRPSVRAHPDMVLADVPATAKVVRVVTVRSVQGRPQIKVTVTPTGRAARAVVDTAQEAPGVVAVAVDQPVAVAASPANDAMRSTQWGLDKLAAEDLWAQQPGLGTVVAVVDSGVDGTHQDLKDVTLPGSDFVTAGGNGWADGDGHGTHVAGIISAVGNNGIGVAGLAQGTRILPVRVLDDTGSGWDSDVADGIIYAADHGASVINLSLGGTSSQVTSVAVNYALGRNISVIAAAGNERLEGNPVRYPAAYPGVVGVAASNTSNAIASFSSTGAYVDLTAPGVSVLSTYKGWYASMSGTSMAAPFVAATAALMKAAKPSLTPAQIATALESTALDLGTAGRDDYSGYGLVSPARALCAVTACATPTPSTEPTPTPTPTVPPPVQAATVTRLLTNAATVTYGGVVTGRAQLLDGATNQALPGTIVRLCTRTAPSAVYGCQTRTTGADGTLTYSFKATASVSLFAAHPGTGTTLASKSQTLTYRVVPAWTLYSWPGKLRVELRPAARQYLDLDQWNGHRWVRRTRGRVNLAGAYTFLRLPRAHYRVSVSATNALSRVVTRSIYVR